ncbi:MAG: glycosyltransferase [Candidatus Omnitrophica bacterium]|nr:glycosyltransferase [Candidatus Omnitrophota bacterium]
MNPWILFYGLVFCVWIYRSWRALQAIWQMPAITNKPKAAISNPPFVSIIVPAKNEEKNIAACLKALLAQDYPAFEVIVVNDNSSDRTGQIIEELKNQKLISLNAPPTPAGWTGKNFALHSAIPAAKGQWFLFTDADTRHEPYSLSQSLHHALSRQLDLLTLLPRCIAGSFMEYFIQPCAMSYLGLWFPMEKVNNPADKAYFANGQFLMLKRSLYEAIGGHAAVRGEFLEDFAIAKRTKQRGARTECALGVKVYGTRMYDSIPSIWRGWRRIFLHAFEKNPWQLALKIMSVFIFSVLPFLFIPRASDGMMLPLATLFMILIICAVANGIVKAKKAYALLHPLAALFLMGILFDAMRLALTKAETKWR